MPTITWGYAADFAVVVVVVVVVCLFGLGFYEIVTISKA